MYQFLRCLTKKFVMHRAQCIHMFFCFFFKFTCSLSNVQNFQPYIFFFNFSFLHNLNIKDIKNYELITLHVHRFQSLMGLGSMLSCLAVNMYDLCVFFKALQMHYDAFRMHCFSGITPDLRTKFYQMSFKFRSICIKTAAD